MIKNYCWSTAVHSKDSTMFKSPSDVLLLIFFFCLLLQNGAMKHYLLPVYAAFLELVVP
jgi:hypothetical protein